MSVSTTTLRRIAELKEMRRAVILAHNYQRDEVQDLADFVGDSLELARKAASTDAEVIVFCGVHFMAETASILSPSKTVLLPDPLAGCPMADMITPEALREKKRENPGVPVVAYVNTSAAVKALSDICSTSSNAVRVVESLPGDSVLFVPDYNLGHFVSLHTRKKMILYDGFCPTHVWIKPDEILERKRAHPAAVVMVHPECSPDVVAIADRALSTGQMLAFARESSAAAFIVGTENGILHRLRKENPGKRFIPVTERTVCPNMKRITPEKVLRSLETFLPEVRVPADIRAAAKLALDRMLEVK
jgi:quinolinate synthase